MEYLKVFCCGGLSFDNCGFRGKKTVLLNQFNNKLPNVRILQNIESKISPRIKYHFSGVFVLSVESSKLTLHFKQFIKFHLKLTIN